MRHPAPRQLRDREFFCDHTFVELHTPQKELLHHVMGHRLLPNMFEELVHGRIVAEGLRLLIEAEMIRV